MSLRTRKPSGAVAFPLLLIEGPEKSGKTFAALALSASERVGRTFVVELGERAADEYAPLGDFEIIEHNGTYADILDQLRAACAEPQVDDLPNVIVLDSASMLWALLKDQASAAARRSKRALKILAEDPDADIETTMMYWTAAKERWWSVVNLLRGWPGITVLTCRAGEVTKVAGGQPVAGQTEWSRDVEKGTPFAMTGIVRAQHPKPPLLTTVQSLSLSIPAKGLLLPADASLESLIFDTLGAGAGFVQSPVVNPSAGIPVVDAKNILWADACGTLGRDEALTFAAEVWSRSGLDGRAEVTDDELAAAKSLLAQELEGRDPFEGLPHAKPVQIEPTGDASPSDAEGGSSASVTSPVGPSPEEAA
jgi:hypothetical protein